MSIDEKGYHRKTLDENLIELGTLLKNNIGNISLDPSNIMYQWLKVIGMREVQLQSLTELIFANMTPQGASGIFLDYHLLMNGLKRKDAEYAVGTLEITNNNTIANQSVPIGTIFSTSDGTQYYTITDGVFVEYITVTHTNVKDVIDSRYYKITPDTNYGPLTRDTISTTTTNSITVSTGVDSSILNSSTKEIYTIDTNDYSIKATYTYSAYDPSTKTFTISSGDPSSETGYVYIQRTATDDAYWINGVATTGGTAQNAVYYLDNTNNAITYDYCPFIIGQSYIINMKPPMTISVSIRAVDIGTIGNTGANSITVNTNAYGALFISSVTNNVAITNGTDVETDNSAKVRLINAKNRHFTLGSIRDMVTNLNGVKECKVSQVLTTDYSTPIVSSWDSLNDGVVFDFDDYKCIRVSFAPVDAVTIKGITLRAIYTGTPPNLNAQLVEANKLLNPSNNRILAFGKASIADMREGADQAQDLFIPLKYEGLEKGYNYYINIYADDSSEPSATHKFSLVKDNTSSGTTIFYCANNMSVVNLNNNVISGGTYMLYTYSGANDSAGLNLVDSVVIGEEDVKPCVVFPTYNIILLSTKESEATASSYTNPTLTLNEDLSGTFTDAQSVTVIIFDDNDEFYLKSTATYNTNGAGADTLIFSNDINVPSTPTGYHFLVYEPQTGSDTIGTTYLIGEQILLYEAKSDNTLGDLAIKTNYGIPAINVSVRPDEGYNFETELKEDIENMLDWEGGDGYCPLGIEYSVSEATKLLMDVSLYVGIQGNYTITDINGLIINSIDNYLSGLSNGDDIVYSQIYKVIMDTPGIYRIKNLSIIINGITSSDNDERDIVINEGEYVELNSVSLKLI